MVNQLILTFAYVYQSEATVAELKSHLKTKTNAVRKLSQTPVVRTSRLNGQLMGVGSDEADDEADVSRMEFENIINRVRRLLTCALFYVYCEDCYSLETWGIPLWLDVSLMSTQCFTIRGC